jgi:Sulfotransferase domain
MKAGNQNACPPKVVRLPNVQLIGAQKAGTSAVADFLFDGGFRRPEVFDDEPIFYGKEVHFFDDDWRYQQGAEFYAKRFQHCGLDCNTMDATPDTLPFAERVRATYDAAGGDQTHTVKIIVILREQVSRELSLYNHLAYDCRLLGASERNEWQKQVTRDDGSIMSFDEFVFEKSIPALGRETGPGRSTRHALYVVHLRKWFQLFDRKQILVLSYDELSYHPDRLQERIQSFLGHEVCLGGELKRSNCNDSNFKVRLPSAQARDALLSVFAPLNADLYKLLESNPGPVMEQKPFPRFQDTEFLQSESTNHGGAI